MQNQQVLTFRFTCDGSFSYHGHRQGHRKITFEVDASEIHSEFGYGSLHDLTIAKANLFCPICELRDDMNQLNSDISNRETQLYDTFSNVINLEANGQAAINECHSVIACLKPYGQDLAEFASLNQRLAQMLAWWEANVAVEGALINSKGPAIEDVG